MLHYRLGLDLFIYRNRKISKCMSGATYRQVAPVNEKQLTFMLESATATVAEFSE
jgi:hypothetical protein